MDKKTKNFGINAILKLYDLRLLWKGAKYPLIFTVIIVSIFLFVGEIDKEIIKSVVDLILSIIPSLLGFVLSGYALLIGFGNIEIIAKRRQTEVDKEKPTLYQKVSTVFAVALIMQIVLLVFTFILKVLLQVDLPCIFDNCIACEIVNYIVFILLIFGLLYVTVMIKDLVVNIFNFSQIQHFFINKAPDPTNTTTETE
ncbi:hypothetical protein [Paludibacter jiangxiensis]|uniref:Uncharacterized protein n=1 Tax=Paludibacter jiangxiensis TaxID=681398 RepID=A0A161LEN0_9BACT|nr:hypothetical protein [Paludibacter jiangxiensis]GAT62787.1 hypothetical protein PJIAN_390 [Paludibacter jiangxiensis]